MKEKYGVKEYIEEYRQALEQKPEIPKAKPNAIKELLAKAKLSKK